MSWKITAGWSPADADAAAYITAVETADAQALENGVKVAIDNFVLGCKADGIWSAIKASCILAGARTLTGALVPLVGTAPTNVGPFVSGDYNRKTGLVGNGSTKYLNSNRNNNADPQDSNHNALWATTIGINALIGPSVSTTGINSISPTATRNRNLDGEGLAVVPGFTGISRGSASSYSQRTGGQSFTQTRTSQSPDGGNIRVFSFTDFPSTHRLAFYSIGESLNLALLDTRVSTLINAFAAAIP
jgi:hypothetical protein